MLCELSEYQVPMPVISDEDWERYDKQVKESEGFDVDYFPGIMSLPGYLSHVGHGQYEYYSQFLFPEIDQYNQRRKVEGGILIEFERIIKLNFSFPATLFFTFEARDVPDGTKRTYQAQVVAAYCRDDNDVMIFREKASASSVV